MTTLLFDY